MPSNITIVNNTIFTNNQYAINAAEVDASMFYDISVDKNIIVNRNSKVKTPEGEYNSSKYYYSFLIERYVRKTFHGLDFFFILVNIICGDKVD